MWNSNFNKIFTIIDKSYLFVFITLTSKFKNSKMNLIALYKIKFNFEWLSRINITHSINYNLGYIKMFNSIKKKETKITFKSHIYFYLFKSDIIRQSLENLYKIFFFQKRIV